MEDLKPSASAGYKLFKLSVAALLIGAVLVPLLFGVLFSYGLMARGDIEPLGWIVSIFVLVGVLGMRFTGKHASAVTEALDEKERAAQGPKSPKVPSDPLEPTGKSPQSPPSLAPISGNAPAAQPTRSEVGDAIMTLQCTDCRELYRIGVESIVTSWEEIAQQHPAVGGSFNSPSPDLIARMDLSRTKQVNRAAWLEIDEANRTNVERARTTVGRTWKCPGCGRVQKYADSMPSPLRSHAAAKPDSLRASVPAINREVIRDGPAEIAVQTPGDQFRKGETVRYCGAARRAVGEWGKILEVYSDGNCVVEWSRDGVLGLYEESSLSR